MLFPQLACPSPPPHLSKPVSLGQSGEALQQISYFNRCITTSLHSLIQANSTEPLLHAGRGTRSGGDRSSHAHQEPPGPLATLLPYTEAAKPRPAGKLKQVWKAEPLPPPALRGRQHLRMKNPKTGTVARNESKRSPASQPDAATEQP